MGEKRLYTVRVKRTFSVSAGIVTVCATIPDVKLAAKCNPGPSSNPPFAFKCFFTESYVASWLPLSSAALATHASVPRQRPRTTPSRFAIATEEATDRRRGGVRRRQLELKGAEGGG